MRIILSLCMVLFFSLPGFSVTPDSLRLSTEEWNELKEGVDYTENFKTNEPDAPKKNQDKTTFNTPDFDLREYKYIFYVLVLALIGFLCYRVFKNFNSNPEIENKSISIDSIKEIEENMHQIDLDGLLQQALAAKNYRIALRIHFLIIIKALSQKGKINWAKEKTNWEYYSEINDKIIADQFKDITVAFESVWYGEHAFNEMQYHFIAPAYHSLQKKLLG